MQDSRKEKPRKQGGAREAKQKAGKPETQKAIKPSIQPGRRKVTYVIASDLVRRLKVLGAETDRELSDLVSEAIEDLIKRKTIKPMPKGEHEAL
jgi:hypothetical protein